MFNDMIYCNCCQSVAEITIQAEKYNLIDAKQYWSERDNIAKYMKDLPHCNSTPTQNQPIAVFQRRLTRVNRFDMQKKVKLSD